MHAPASEFGRQRQLSGTIAAVHDKDRSAAFQQSARMCTVPTFRKAPLERGHERKCSIPTPAAECLPVQITSELSGAVYGVRLE
jgi:hypothetical protein